MDTTATPTAPLVGPPRPFSLRCLVGIHDPKLTWRTEPGATAKYLDLWHEVKCTRCDKVFALHMQSVLKRRGRMVGSLELEAPPCNHESTRPVLEGEGPNRIVCRCNLCGAGRPERSHDGAALWIHTADWPLGKPADL